MAWVAGMLSEVSLAVYQPKDVPDVRFDRLNQHYRSVVTLARLVLRHGAFEVDRGEVLATGFLMDMNDVFQQFVTVALREALGGYLAHLGHGLALDSAPLAEVGQWGGCGRGSTSRCVQLF